MQANSHTPTLPNLILADLLTLAPALRARFPDLPPNPPLEPQAEQQRLFESVVALCAALAARAPALIVIDDAHWADGGTLALVRYLARRAQRSQLRLLIVLTYREVELAEARTLNTVLADLNHERLAERLKLTRLSREQTRDLLAALFQDDIRPEFLDGIYHETEGNPFFVEEVCKALIEEGKVHREGGQWRRPAMSEIRVPQSVRVAIETRVGKLAEAIQETLRLAAILGRKFDFETLQAADEQHAEDMLIEALEQAERAQLIAEVGRAGGGTFEFAHALIPATLTEGVSGLRRRRLHKRAASAIEHLRPDDYEALAYHCAQAADDDRARTFYIQAADRARAVYANDEAIRFYTEALTLTSATDASRFDLLAARAKVYDIVARREQQRADIDAMLALAEKLNDDARRCDALIALADFYLATEVAHAEETAHRAVALARQMNDRVHEGRALQRAGHALWMLVKWEESRSLLEATVACFREANLPSELAASLSLLSLAQRDLLELTAAQTTLDEVIALTRQIGDKSQEATAMRRKAILLNALLDRPAEALPLAEAALTVHRTTGNRREEADSLNILAQVFIGLRQFDIAKNYCHQFLELSEVTGYSEGTGVAVNVLGFVHAIFGEYEASLKLIDDAHERARKLDNEFLVANLNSVFCKSFLLGRLGQYQVALEVSQERLAFAEKYLGVTAQGYALLSIANYQGELGRYAQAHAALDRAWEKLTYPEVHPMERTGVWVWRSILNWQENTPASLNAGLENAQSATMRLATVEILYRYWLARAHLHTARLHLTMNTPEAALAASTEALRVEIASPFFDVEGMMIHFTHSRTLRANGRAAEADAYLQKAYDRVMLVAGKLQDPELRRSWLENVRDNREIVREWEALKH
jgi:predicted ATPase